MEYGSPKKNQERNRKKYLARKDSLWFQDYRKRYNERRRGIRNGYSAIFKNRSYKNYLRLCLSHAISHSKTCNREVTITLDFLMSLLEVQEYKCAISGLKMTHMKGLKCVSIDRIDSSHGYTENNVQLVCKAMNLAKNVHSNQEMVDFIRSIKMDLLKNLKRRRLLILGAH